MEEFQELYTKVILIKSLEMDLSAMKNRDVSLEVDVAYAIGKSVAVILEGQVIGHLPHFVARPVWTHLKFGHRLEATIYDRLDNGFINSVVLSSLSKSPEVGIRIRFFYLDCCDGDRRISGNSDAKFFLAYVLRHRLNSFPGVTVSDCPPALKHFLG